MGTANRHLKQDITYWAPSGRSDDNEVSYAAPTLLKGRWVDVQEIARNSRGDEVVSAHIVYLDRDVKESGYLALGDHRSQDIPTDLDDVAFEVKAYSSAPDLRYMEQERKALL